MNRTKELMGIMQAYLDGKPIQWKEKRSADNWKDCDEEPSWHPSNDYRIKPEPKYRPLKPEELLTLKGKWLRSKGNSALYSVYTIGSNCIGIGNHDGYSPKNLLQDWTYEDGSPIGVLEEK